MRIHTYLLLFSFFGSLSLSVAGPVTVESLLNEMGNRSALTRTPEPAYVAKAATSYDRASITNNPEDGLFVETKGRDWGKGWFANHDFSEYIRREKNQGRNESVLMENNGPGAIVRWWAPSCKKGMIRIYLDGSSTPVIEMQPDELIGGNKLVSYPFSFLASDDKTRPTWRGRNLYLPIPYQKSCKVTWEGKPFYYQIGYRKYAQGTKVKTFALEQLKSARETMKQVAERLTTGSTVVSGKNVAKTDVVLAPEESTSLTLSEPGAITRLLVQLSAEDYRQVLRSTVVTMTFDGKKSAWIPIGSLGGVGYSAEKNDTFYVKVDPATRMISSYYVMPFQKTATITLTNYGKQDVTIKQLELTVDDYRWNNRSLHFHATWFEQRNISTQNRSDLNYVTVKGVGRYVGTSITIFNTCTLKNNRTWWGEGDDKVYVDGEDFPSIFGTGTEDYFGYAWCRPQRFWTPFISQPRGEGNKKWGYSNNNRYHLLDDYPFTKSIQFDMEIWHPFRKNMNYAVSTFFYARPGSTHNKAPDLDSVKHKVALHRDDVISLGASSPAQPVQTEDASGESILGKIAAKRLVKVFIVAGQSNAVGHNRVKEYKKGRVEFPKAYRHQPDVLFWGKKKTKGWSTLDIATSGAFGPEIGFAYDMAAELRTQRIAIVKYAVGGSGIARSVDYSDYIPKLKGFNDHGNNWHPPAEGKEAGKYYLRLIKNVRDSLEALDRQQIKWELAGCLWMQGEHEAGISRKMAQDYDQLLAGLISAIRKDLKAPSLPFIIGEVNSHTWVYGEIARGKQALVCQQDREAILVKTTDLSRKGSGGAAHFDADGMLVLGSRFAKAAISLAGKDETEQSPGGVM